MSKMMDANSVAQVVKGAEDKIAEIKNGLPVIGEYVKVQSAAARKVADLLDPLVAVLLVLRDHFSLVGEIVLPKPRGRIGGFIPALRALGFGGQASSLYAIMRAATARELGWDLPLEMIRAGVSAQSLMPVMSTYIKGDDDLRADMLAKTADLTGAATDLETLKAKLRGEKGAAKGKSQKIAALVAEMMEAVERKIKRAVTAKGLSAEQSRRKIKIAEREALARLTKMFARLTHEIEAAQTEEDTEEESAAA